MRVAVIGAGAAGLAAAKALCEVGVRPTVFEETGEVGGLWVYREEGTGPAYHSLRTNTSKQITAFSDFPFPEDTPDFPTRAEVAVYLRRYAESFGLVSLITFGAKVERLLPNGSGWTIATADGSDRYVDAVAVCSGIFRKPNIPAIPGLAGFGRRVVHSLDYRRPEAFSGQDVLVVGIGSSAADIAADLVGTAARVSLSVRRGAWIAPRLVAGRPLDHYSHRLAGMLPAPLRTYRRRRLLLDEYARRGIESPAETWARAHVPFDPETAPGVGSDALLGRIAAGEIDTCPEIVRIEEAEVVFADGRRLRPDAIIFCTGYTLAFPFLPAKLRPWRDSSSGLYGLVFPPGRPRLPFIGVCRVHGPILPIVEMQARWMAGVLTAATTLPPEQAMRAEIIARWQRQAAAHDSTIRVSLLPYLDEISARIGARPHLWQHPALLQALLSGPPVAAQYRLEGPDPWSEAAAAILASDSKA